ncbi:PaaI family thioesterase [Ornithinimicrobium flavum]|uniref:PaaI family thioesterase n=1 Tax=Ornithinimicrobium flavum TaxID=1288636 RepID=UPI001930E573|nr:PaaI family thioesterase [Ornithinimicrobium flavum]
MSPQRPHHPQFDALVRASFERQGIMRTLGADLTRVLPGQVDIAVPYHEGLTQQHGYFHAGVATTLVDSACGYAALTLMPEGSEVLSVEFKTNFLAPARGEFLRAEGRVLRAGRTITVCHGDVYAVADGEQTHCATMIATMIRVDSTA